MKVKDTYIRNATMVRVVDGDTVDLNVDLGCDISVKMRCRLDGINAPEMKTAEGKASKAYLEQLFPAGTELVVQTVKDRKEKYGRYLAVLFGDGVTGSVNDALVAQGLAASYDGGKR